LPTGNEGNEAEKGKNVGKLILDATCTPADIHYPTDIWLLNEAREALEEIIDVLHEPHIGQCVKPRTYRESARKKYLNVEKKKKLTAKKIRKAIGQQLRYIRRDLQIIEKLVEKSPLKLLNKRQYRNLLVSQEIYRQQLKMYQTKEHQVEDRIVSLYMPFVRPIVRGKTHAEVEFGAKLAISIVNGFCFMEHLSFDAFN
jgi:IS5 family transposase